MRIYFKNIPNGVVAGAGVVTDAALPARCVRVALDVPLPGPFDYRVTEAVAVEAIAVGARVIVPFGRRRMVGVVVQTGVTSLLPAAQLRDVARVLDDLPRLPADWLRLAEFAARYYQRPLGEVMLPALPTLLRKPSAYEGRRAGGGPVVRAAMRAAMRLRPRRAPAVAADAPAADAPAAAPPVTVAPPELNPAQQAAVAAISSAAQTGFRTILLHGVTGSGKTEVYLRAAEQVLATGRQVLMLVPEINLTPQFENALRARLERITGPDSVALLHSGRSDTERLRAWVDALTGQARIVLGTRLALFAPLADLGLIVVDEEHDASYKQQEGLRYSARDLAIWRARDRGIPVVLGSATPALETWHRAQTGQYLKLTLPARARGGALPAMRLIDTRRLAMPHGLSPQLQDAIAERLARGEQALVFLNRRGFAPTLTCNSCGWVSQCPRCTAYTVLHRAESGHHFHHHHLHCHHCGYQARVPAACPDCGDQDLRPMGRGTQRIEEHLRMLYPQARVLRIDADSTRRKGSAEALFNQVHAGEVDILVGTQMVAKGHDFARLTLVGVLNADAMLFAHDFRAPERLFAQLMQVAGRAGRHGPGGEVLIQTGYPDQPVYQALVRHDYAGYAASELAQRQAAGLPPYTHQALLTAQAGKLQQALAFLAHARALTETDAALRAYTTAAAPVTLYDPVPLRIVRVAHVERAQLLIEAVHRGALQTFLPAWLERLAALPAAAQVRWQLEVDPLEI